MHVDMLRDLWRKFSAPLGLFISWVSEVVSPTGHTHTHTHFTQISAPSPCNQIRLSTGELYLESSSLFGIYCTSLG